MKIVIGGCRDFNDYNLIEKTLDEFFSEIGEEVTILSGHCRGADILAERYAAEKGIRVEIYTADWARYGRAAGPLRNREMVERGDMVIAFWDGSSKGTGDLIKYAKKLSKPVRVVKV